jgi:hypothetical protein
VEFIGTDLEALAYVDAMNFHRRHLGEADRDIISRKSVSRRALLAGRAASAKHGGDRRSDQDANLHLDPKTIDQAAAEQGISRRSAADGKKVVEHGTTKLQSAVIGGAISVSDAAKIATHPACIQDQAVADVASGKANTATKAASLNNTQRLPNRQAPCR